MTEGEERGDENMIRKKKEFVPIGCAAQREMHDKSCMLKSTRVAMCGCGFRGGYLLVVVEEGSVEGGSRGTGIRHTDVLFR